MSRVNYITLQEIVIAHRNGNIEWAMTEIKKLKRADRARIVGVFHSIAGANVAFEIADKIIMADFK